MNDEEKISEKTIRALKIVRDHPGITARFFACKMWPDSEAWCHVINTGHGATSGKGMWLSAGCYLAKLRERKLVIRCFSGNKQAIFYLSGLGYDLLRINDED